MRRGATLSAVKEHPILFSAPMVRALMNGSKTVTRRQVKVQPFDLSWSRRDHRFEYTAGRAANGDEIDGLYAYSTRSGGEWSAKCPYGQPGDRLWVRETWGVISHDFDEHANMIDWTPDRPATPIREMPFGRGYYSGHVIYRADGEATWAGDDDGGGDDRSCWKPSIHMPRIASRILLEITDVRIERLQAGEGETASESRYVAEGINRIHHGNGEYYFHSFKYEAGPGNWIDPFDAWRELWVSINGAEAWNTNPWVWVVEFKRVTP
jgi:hypothetical protein